MAEHDSHDTVSQAVAAMVPSWGDRVGRPPRRPHYPCLHGGTPQLESLPDLLELLPPDFNYHVCAFEALPGGFAVTLRINLDSESGARAWLAAFQQSSLTTFRSRRTFPRPGPRLLYKAWFRCQRNVPGSAAAAGGRNTSCPATLAVSVCSPRVSRRADPHLPHSPGCVRLKHVHNHPVRCAADLRFRGVSAAARGALEALMARGYSPAAARRALQHQLQLQLGERYPLAAADRAVLPSLKDVCRIFYRQYGTPADRRAVAITGDSGGNEEMEHESADTDDPKRESDNTREMELASEGAKELGSNYTNPSRLELELVDAECLMFDCAGGDGPLVESVNTHDPEVQPPQSQSVDAAGSVVPNADQEGVSSGSVDSNALTLDSSGGKHKPTDPTEQTGQASDFHTLEVEFVRAESPTAITPPSAKYGHQRLDMSDSMDPAVEAGADLTAASRAAAVPRADSVLFLDGVASGRSSDPVPSLQNLLQGCTVPSPDAAAARLEHLVSEYTEAMSGGGGAAAFRRFDGGFAAALTTPLMRRVHRQLPQSGELVFVDCAGHSERHGCCLWLLVCASEAGALPLGLLLASSAAGGALRAALTLWQRTLSTDAFAGRAAAGPQVVITDDSAGQRAALAAQFPAALSVLCAFRLLQSVWRWLWQMRGRVSPADRGRLLLLARRLLRAGSVSQLERRFQQAIADSVMTGHPEFLKQFTSIYRHRHLWAVWYGEEETTEAGGGGGRTASLFDLAARLLRDRLLFMAAEYGPADAFDFWTRRGDPYYLLRIERALCGGGGSVSSLPRYVPPPAGGELRARRTGTYEHEVADGATVHLVDLSLACCTCRRGRLGAPCAHQSAAARLECRQSPAPLVGQSAARLRRLAARLPLLEDGPVPLPAGWLQAVTAAAGLPRLEVIVSAEPAALPPSHPQLTTGDADELAASSAEEPADVGPNDLDLMGGDRVDMGGGDGRHDTPDTASAGFIVGDVSDTAARSDAAGSAAGPSEEEEEAMSAAILSLQAVTADLTGRLAAEPARYVPLVRDIVSRYWSLANSDELQALPRHLDRAAAEVESRAAGR